MPRVIVGTPFNIVNRHHIERWVNFHSRYADGLVVSIDANEIVTLADEIRFMKSRKVGIIGVKLEHPNSLNKKIVVIDAMKSLKPEWMGIIPCDETFTENFFDRCDDMFKDKKYLWYSFPVAHLWGDEKHHRVDSWWEAGMTNVRENKKFWQNVWEKYDYIDNGFHSPLPPAQVVYDHRGQFIKDIIVKHYAFLDPKDWDRRCKVYGDEYEFGGGKQNFAPLEKVELRELAHG